ncbi:MerR family transcriptional regulator [Saccharothrix xinjiangensis]|uniref:MerR family transcriptional regulator n=1 Tax=Saccharothrix xinjiangensis TaxID=204798 RepID=A0ABV9XXE5_9PSEU
MHPSFTPPRQVKIGDAAVFAGTTPRAIRHYHEIGLLPEPERGADGRRRYGYDDMIRLLWIRRMAEAGISLDDVRAAFDETRDIEESLGRLEETLAAKEAGIKRQRAVVRRLRAVGSPLGLLSELVADRLGHLPPGALRRSDLDALLVTERVFGPLGAAVQASAFIVLATHPDLRAEDDRLDAAEAALDDGVDPHDPRVEELAAQRYAHCKVVEKAIEADGLDIDEEKLFETYDADLMGEEPARMSVFEAVTKMPYGFSAARIRCVELAGQLLGQDHAADNPSPAPRSSTPAVGHQAHSDADGRGGQESR